MQDFSSFIILYLLLSKISTVVILKMFNIHLVLNLKLKLKSLDGSLLCILYSSQKLRNEMKQNGAIKFFFVCCCNSFKEISFHIKLGSHSVPELIQLLVCFLKLFFAFKKTFCYFFSQRKARAIKRNRCYLTFTLK